jgi:hypothetical protein
LPSVSDFLMGLGTGLVVASVIYSVYALAGFTHARRRATAACFWLPAWECFRLVIRNMDGSTPVTAIRYRTWLRADSPAVPGSTVITWQDRDLSSNERILLPRKEDLTVLSFRYEETGTDKELLLTNKFGAVSEHVGLRPEDARLMLEYSLRLRTWFFYKCDISRVYELRRYEKVEGRTTDLFRTLLADIQKAGEGEVDKITLTDEVISVTV